MKFWLKRNMSWLSPLSTHCIDHCTTCRIFKTYPRDIQRTMAIMVQHGNWAGQIIRRSTLESRKTLARLRSLINHFASQSSTCPCQLLKIELLNGSARHHRAAISVSPCSAFCAAWKRFLRDCILALNQCLVTISDDILATKCDFGSQIDCTAMLIKWHR